MTHALNFVRSLAILGGALLSAQAAQAQTVLYGGPGTVTLTSPNYTENFNSLASSGSSSTALPPGWRVREDGANAAAGYTVGTGSNNAGDVYSFGAAGNSDRALGSLLSDNLTASYFGGFFTNGLGATINSLRISYNGEQYRDGAATNVLAFSYSTNATGLGDTMGTWTPYTLLNFTSPNSTTMSSTAISNTITGLSILNGSNFAIRWTGANQPGADDALAIDDVNIVAGLASATSAVPEPASWAMMFAGFGIVGGSLRSARRRKIAFA